MPSSLMARLKVAGGSAPAPASSLSTGGGGARSHVVTPPPLTTSASASTSSGGASRPASSLAAAAAGRSKDSSLGAATGAKSSGCVPQFKRNPMNVNVTAGAPEARPTAPTAEKATAPAAQAGECKEEKVAAVDAKADPPQPKSTMQKLLLHHTNDPPPVPPAYGMCSQSEALDRQQHLELSPFECDAGSALHGGTISMDGRQEKAARSRPVHNPQYVIKKYRRSAAGGGTLCEESERFPRTIDELSATVDYLLGHIFACQMPPPIEGGDEKDRDTDPNEISIWGDTPVKQRPQPSQHHVPFSLSDTVAFIDDRLRAVQKDLVTLLGNLEEPGSAAADGSAIAKRERAKRLRTKRTAREMQAKMVRYNILASYLLSEMPATKYEAKFGARALRTSLTCYLNLSTALQEEYNNGGSRHQLELETQDEIMAYMALLHSSAVIRSEDTALPPPASGEVTSSLMEDSGSGWGAVLSTFCKHAAGSAIQYRRWKWALDLACAAQEGNCQRYFALLESGPAFTTAADTEAGNARFLILARCCASRTLNLVRVAQVRRYNRAFGKLEKVPGRDLARLLRFKDNNQDEESAASVDRAINLCRDAGLPIVEKEGRPNELFVEMKSAPIKISGEEAIRRMCNPGRVDDLFVFGSKFVIGDDGATSSIQDDVGDWEERETDSTMDQNGSHAGGGARTDEDGVLIPPSNVARNLSL